MSSGLVLAGLGLAAIGFGGRILSRHMPKAAQAFEQTIKSIPTSQGSWANSKYYKGGFEPKMTRREASLVLGVSPNAQVMERNCQIDCF
jgi:DnaJ family protein C protein 19